MSRRIGLTGCGRWGRNILRDLLRLECQVWVHDPDPAAREAALAAGAAAAAADLADWPADLDGFVVASPTTCHGDSVRALLPRGRSVFCEKPLTPGLDDARELAAAAGDRLFVMDKWRYHPGVEALAQIARSGELGAVQQVRTRRVQWGQPHADVDGVWILAPHDVSIVQHILGHLPEPLAASGDWSGDRLDGLVAVLGGRPGAVIEVSSRLPQPARLVSVSFDDGVAWLADPLDDHVRVWRGAPGQDINPDGWERRAVDTEWPLYLELKRFVGHLGGGPPPYTDARAAVEQVALIERLREMAGD
ncbi:MAG: Gfo/Idh/MocA family oxidoreductase [Xanthomonadales bacterium]|nr:Gfo/Idh/MocA family oxidoreductase [Xanthomonadales bacterium]